MTNHLYQLDISLHANGVYTGGTNMKINMVKISKLIVTYVGLLDKVVIYAVSFSIIDAILMIT